MFKNLKRWWGYNTPSSATLKGWDTHDEAFKANAPIRYFFNETIDEYLRIYWHWPIWQPIKHRYERLRNRILPWRQYHIVRTGLKPDYADTDHIMLHANFALLTNFVEVESAWMQIITSDDEGLRPMRWWQRPFFRDRKLGLEYIEWQTLMDDPTSPHYQAYANGHPPQQPWSPDGHPSQAETSRQVKRLYLWWKDDYLKRADLYEGSLSSTQIHDLEVKWGEEEEEALIMLMRIRKGLWT